MSFGDIFWPLFTALVAWSFVVELANLGLRVWADRRERGALKELQERYDRGEAVAFELPADSFDPMELSRLLASSRRNEVTTASGSGDWGGSGQYL